MTSGILKSIKHRDKLFKDQLGKNNAQLCKEFLKYRNKVTRICHAARDLHNFNSFNSIVNNPKKVWCKLNAKFLNKKHCSSALPSEITVKKENFEVKTDIANEFNKYFVNKGHILAFELPESDVDILSSMIPRNENCITEWKRVIVKEVVNIIRKYIHTSTSCGCDGMPAVLIK